MIPSKIYNLKILMEVVIALAFLIRATRSRRDDDLFCSCQKKEIKCKGVQDIDILKMHFSIAAKNCNPQKLKLLNSHLFALPNDLLNGTDITEIKIEDTYLPFLAVPVGGGNPFTGGNSTVKFHIETVRFPYNWQWKILNVCQNLKDLRISKSEMTYVGPKFKKLNLQQLHHLTIQNSNVRWIHDEAFVSLKNLAFLNFRNNKIKLFKRSFLPDPSYLDAFNIRSNELEYLEEDFFRNMPMLTYVNLENNKLITLSEFDNKAFFINLSGNPLRCDCSIEWLNYVKNQTDDYRFRCLDPDLNDKSVKFKDVNWSEKDC